MSFGPFGPMSYPGVNPPQVDPMSGSGMSNGGSPVSTPFSFPTPGNVPYVQPDSSQPAFTANGVQAPQGAEPINENSRDFFQTVKDMVGGVFGAVGGALETEKRWTAIPIYEGLFHPDQFLQATIDRGSQGDFNPAHIIDAVNEKFQMNDDPGLMKFAGELAFDPLTYLSSGVIKGIQYGGKLPFIAKEVAGLNSVPYVGKAAAASLEPLRAGMAKYEQGVDAAISGGSNFLAGAATNYIPLSAAKDVARGTLLKVFPEATVEKFLSTIPEEYTGINIGPLSDWANQAVPNLGLPRVLKIPEFRVVQTKQSFDAAFSAAKNAFANSGINYATSTDSNAILSHLRNIYAADASKLGDNERYVQDIIKRPDPISIPEIKNLNRAVGGSLSDPTTLNQLAINNTFEQYARGIEDGIDQGTAISSLGQLFGVNPKSNPDAFGQFVRFLNNRSDDARQFISNQKNLPALQVTANLAARASERTNSMFSLGIANQRMENTWFDQMLDGFDSRVYKPLWQGLINKWIYKPLNTLSVGSLGMLAMQPAEAYLRHIIEGGGERLSMTAQDFGKRTANIQGVPPILEQLNPPHYTPDENGFISSLMDRMAGWNPTIAKAVDTGRAMDQWSRDFTYTTRMSYWWKMFQANRQDALNAMALPIRDDAKTYFSAASAPQVSQYPELSGVEQSLVDDAFNTAYTNPGSAENIRNVKDSLQTSTVNRKDLSQLVDLPEVMEQLYPGPRTALRRSLLEGEPNSTNLNSAFDTAIDSQKKLLKMEPEAQVQLMQGMVDQLKDQATYPMNSPADLQNAVGRISAIQQHATGIQDMFNKAEADEMSQIQGTEKWGRNMHTAYSKKLQTTLDKINPILEEGYNTILGQADQFGVRPEMDAIVNTMRSDKDLLYQTLADQSQFQKDFFDARPNRRLDQTWNDPLVGYYPRKARIWDGFNAAHQNNLTTLQMQQMALANRIGELQAAGAIKPPVNTIENVLGQAKSADVEVTPEEIANAPQESHPETARLASIIDAGLASGNTPEEIAHAVNIAITPGSGNAGEESVLNPSSTSVGSQISGAIDNATVNAGGNASAAESTIDPESFLGTRYAALDSFRQRLNDLAQERLGAPKMTDEAHQFLSDRLDKVYTEYSALPPEVKGMMDDATKVAVERTNQMHDQAFTNYDARNNFDKLMLHFIPFWMHESRRWPWLARTFLGKPSLISFWQAYQDNTDQGYMPLHETPLVGGMINLLPSGNSWSVNPFRLITPFNPIEPANQFKPAQFTGGLAGAMQNIDLTMQQMGFNLGEMFDIPEAVAQGNIGSMEPPAFKTALNAARGSNVPGLSAIAANIQNMLPDNYRDYYTRMILASQGFEPDKVYNSALDGDPTSTATLDIAQQQSSLVSAVLAQSGVLRYRTPEWTAYQKARFQAIASMTGLSEFDQNVLKNQGISIQQLKALTPMQRQELGNLPGARAFNELSEPLLNPAARKLRELQNQFYQTVDDERDQNNQDQLKDDNRLQNGLISGVEWRRRYQDRTENVSNLIDDLKKSPAYKNVPVSAEEQAQSRARFNLPPFVQSPEDIALHEYYAVKPESDPITGDINFSDFFDRRQAVLDKYPDLQTVLNDKLAANNTAQVVDFKRAAEILRPYFSIPDQIAAQHPEIQAAVSQLKMLSNTDKIAASTFREMHPEIATLNRMIKQTQEEARRQFPQIDAALVKYYGATPIEYHNIRRNGNG